MNGEPWDDAEANWGGIEPNQSSGSQNLELYLTYAGAPGVPGQTWSNTSNAKVAQNYIVEYPPCTDDRTWEAADGTTCAALALEPAGCAGDPTLFAERCPVACGACPFITQPNTGACLDETGALVVDCQPSGPCVTSTCLDGACVEESVFDGTPCGEGSACQSGVCAPPPYQLIDAGSFQMGSPETEPCRVSSEETQHPVTLNRAFWMKTTEVTQGEWQALMGNNPSYFNACGESCPVERVSWWEALAYCNALSAHEGLTPCYDLSYVGTPGDPEDNMSGASVTVVGGDVYACEGYRLPTEAEWEYAARAGTTEATYAGDIELADCDAQSTMLDTIAWYAGNSGSQSYAAGQLEA
ncbi:MAG: formylglycine-generating enzyme family protein, partial [Myxococcota bacterium]|nr:formylglycine-generating enzyme family protein [Myxococcota bacterium]